MAPTPPAPVISAPGIPIARTPRKPTNAERTAWTISSPAKQVTASPKVPSLTA